MSRRVGYDNAKASTRSRIGLWDHLLTEGEETLWEGRPGYGFQINGSAFRTLIIVAVGLLVLGPQILGGARNPSLMGEMLSVPYIGPISGKVFLMLAVGWTVVWFVMQTTTTPLYTHYMLSDRRAFIAKTFLWKRVKSYELSPMRVIEYDGKKNGSIIFASETKRADNGRKRDFPVGFMHVKNAEHLYKKMLEVQRKDAHEQR